MEGWRTRERSARCPRGMRPLLSAALPFLVSAQACALFHTSVERGPVNLGEVCAPATDALDVRMPGAEEAPGPRDRETSLEDFSPRAQHTARALGLIPVLRELTTLERTQHADLRADDRADDRGVSLPLMAVHHEILARLYLADQEIGRLEGEVSCEQGRVQELKDRLQTQKSQRSNIQTLAAVVIQGAAAAISAALVVGGTTVATDAVAIAGGAIGATLGSIAILQRGDQQIEHPLNLLREVREGPEKGRFRIPESVWRLLTVSDGREQSRREQLLDHWNLELERVQAKKGEESERLQFSDGGSYSIDDLRTRSAMLRTLVGTLRRLHEDIEVLSREVLKRPLRRRPSQSSPTRGER